MILKTITGLVVAVLLMASQCQSGALSRPRRQLSQDLLSGLRGAFSRKGPGGTAGAAPLPTVDLVFLVDVTGSMGPYINGVLQSIRDVVQILTKPDSADPIVADIRLSFVGYRDTADGADHFQIYPFTRNVDVFLGNLNRVRATGGGDTPEDVFGGLQKVADLNFAHGSQRVLFHIADQYCHHERCVPRGATHSPDPMHRSAPIVLRPLKNIDVDYNFGTILPHATNKMLAYFRETMPIKDFEVNGVTDPATDRETGDLIDKYGVGGEVESKFGGRGSFGPGARPGPACRGCSTGGGGGGRPGPAGPGGSVGGGSGGGSNIRGAIGKATIASVLRAIDRKKNSS